MKRKCMKDGGQAKTLQEQLAQIKKKVGYANGGAVIGDDEQQRLLQPPVLDDQVAGFLSSVPAVRTPTPSLGPNLAQYASQPGTGQSLGYLGAPTAQSVGQRRAGAPSSGFLPGAVDQGQEQISKIQGMSGLSSRQKAAALSDVAGRLDDYGIKTDIGGALGSAAGGLSQRQKLALEQAQFGSNLNADRVAARGGIGAPLSPAGAQEDQSAYDPLTMPRGRQRRQRGFQDGGRVFKQGTTFSDRPLTPEPGSYPRAMPPAVTQGSRDKQVRFQAPRPVQPAVAASSYAPQGAYLGITGVADAIRDRKWKNAEAANYADGGMVKFAGKGGPRGDKIPVKVAGAEINVSNGENAVILPAKTAANRAAVQAINGIIQATNDGRKPSAGIEDGGKYQAGAYPYDGKRPPTAQEPYGKISPGGIAAALTPETWKAAKVVAPPGSVGGGMSSSGTDPRDIPEGGTITNLAPALSQIHQFAKPAYDLSPSMRALQSTAGGIGQVFADSAQAQQEGVSYQDIQARKAREQAAPPVAPSPVQTRAVNSAASAQQGIAQGVRPAQRPAMHADSGATQSNGLTVTQMGAGFDPTRLTMAPGYGMASNAAGKTVSVGPSQYVAADGSPTSRWEDTAAYQDAISRNERNKIRLAEMQANRSGQNPLATLAASRSISDAAMNAPFDQQTRQAQAQSAAMDLAQKKRVDALAETYRNAKTPEEQAKALDEFNALTGRSKEEWKAVHAAGRQTIDGKEPDQVILYNSKGETRVLGAGVPAQSPQTQAAEAIKSQMLAGKITREQAVNELKKLGFQ
jgi:hypothetical protein